MVLKPCGHSSAEIDPHPYCDSCATDLTINPTGRLCIPTDSCEYCEDTPSTIWKLIDRYRTNKRKRRKRIEGRRQESIHEVCSTEAVRDRKLSVRKALQAVEAVQKSTDVTADTKTVDYHSENAFFDIFNTTPEGSDFSFTDNMGSKKEVKKPTAAATKAVKQAAIEKRLEAMRVKMERELEGAEAPEDVPVSPPKKSAKPSSRASSSTSIGTKSKKKRRVSISPIPKDKRQKRSRSPQHSGDRKQKRTRSDQRSPSKDRSPAKASRHRPDSDRRRHSTREKRSHSSRRRADKRRSMSRSVSRHRRDQPTYEMHEASRSRSRSRQRDSRRARRSFSSQRSNRSYTGIISQRRQFEAREEKKRQDESYRSDRRHSRSRSPRARHSDKRSDSRDRHQRKQRTSYSPGEVYRQAKLMFESFREKQLEEEGVIDDADSDDDLDLVEPSKTVFPFKEVITLMAKHSDVELKEGASYTSRGFQMASDDPASNVKKEFKALTTSLGLVEAVKLWQEDFAKRDAKPKKKVKRGEFVKCNKLRSSLRSYKSGDDWLTMDPLFHEKQNYAWLAQPSQNVSVTQSDLIYMEGQMRSILRVVNFMEVLNQTVNAGLALPFDIDIMQKLHMCNKQATRDLIKLSTGMFCGIAQLRKDDILMRSPKIPTKLETRLRHTELAEVQNMFPEQLLVEIDGVYTQQLSTSVMEKYTVKGKGGYNPKQTQQRGYGGYQAGYQQGGYQQDRYQREFKRGRGRGAQGGSR